MRNKTFVLNGAMKDEKEECWEQNPNFVRRKSSELSICTQNRTMKDIRKKSGERVQKKFCAQRSYER